MATKKPRFIRIKLAGASSFGEVSIKEDDTVARLAQRACGAFRSWKVDGLDATQLSLYLVAEGGDIEPSEAATIAVLSGSRLGAGKSLESERIFSGAWLVARVIPAQAKKFFLVVSGKDRWDEVVPVTMAVSISTDKEYVALIKHNGGGNVVPVGAPPPHPQNSALKDIVDGETYTLLGGRQRTYLDKENRTQQADRKSEGVSTLAVRDAYGETLGKLQMHLDTKLKNRKGSELQFDGSFHTLPPGRRNFHTLARALRVLF